MVWEWELSKGQLKHDSGLAKAKQDTARWTGAMRAELQQLAAAPLAGSTMQSHWAHTSTEPAAWQDSEECNVEAPSHNPATAGSGSVERTLGLSYWLRRSPLICPGTKAYEAGSKPLGEWLRAHHPQLAGTAIGPMSLHGSVDGLGSTGGLYAEPSEPGPNTPPLAKRSKRTKAEQAAEPTQPTEGKGKAKGKAAKAKLAPQPGRWLDRDCNAALNMQRVGESRWCPLELCWWPNQAALPAKDKEYPELGYKWLRDRPPKAQQQQQQPARAQ
ncbi:hypothetical protein QJQ45_026424 [Haematococcus lacustris]|nr:hypothetical protein QJQ45_026424 [Haematococcus lacustris]